MSISLLGNLKAFDLTQLIETVVGIYVSVAEESNQTLIAADGASKLKLWGDADLLMQMLANLIENSIRHCPAQTVIRMESGQSKKVCGFVSLTMHRVYRFLSSSKTLVVMKR